MKRRLCLLLIALLLISGALAEGTRAPHEADAGEYDGIVEPALEAALEAWRLAYSSSMYEGHAGYLEIKNTRVLKIAEAPHDANPVSDKPDRAAETFGGLKYIVEFTFASDYFLTEPYYTIGTAPVATNALIHADGSVTLSGNSLLAMYSSRTYSYDYSGIIEQIIDLNGAYNAVYRLLEE